MILTFEYIHTEAQTLQITVSRRVATLQSSVHIKFRYFSGGSSYEYGPRRITNTNMSFLIDVFNMHRKHDGHILMQIVIHVYLVHSSEITASYAKFASVSLRLIKHMFADISLISFKFPDIPRFSRWVAILITPEVLKSRRQTLLTLLTLISSYVNHPSHQCSGLSCQLLHISNNAIVTWCRKHSWNGDKRYE